MIHRVADAHVDALWRLACTQAGGAPQVLASGIEQLRAGRVALQVFALFVPPHLSPSAQLEKVLQEIDVFYEKLAGEGGVQCVRTATDMGVEDAHLAGGVHETGSILGLLSLEGAGCLGGQLSVLRILYHLGVRGIGLTWNYANDLADGCLEGRGAGLTHLGRQVVQEAERLGMWVDISHLGDAGVADVLRVTHRPVMASHANARSVHLHPRNLTDDVLREVFQRRGFVGITFQASFVADPATAQISDVFRHIDHMLSLGGEDCIGFGSDFDGISHPLPGLTSSADFAQFVQHVEDRYGHAITEKLAFRNLERYLRRVLPASSSSQP